MSKRSTIGDNPLDAVIPVVGRTTRPEPSPTATARPARQPVRSSRKVRATFHIPEDLLEEARDAAVALSGPPHRLTLATLAENALRNEIERLRTQFNGDQPFPTREEGSLRGGRPIGS